MAFTEIKAPRQIRFENVGDKIQGLLVAIRAHTVNGKKTKQYMLELENGDRVTFLETYNLAEKITPKMAGYPLFVEFEGYHDSIEKEGHRMKVFKVMVDWSAKPTQAQVQALEITDEDIPF